MLKNEITRYKVKEDTFINSYSYYNNNQYLVNDTFFFAMKRDDKVSFVSGELPRIGTSVIEIINSTHEREEIYINAIENLLKQKKYLNLLYELNHDYITEEEFNKELEENENSYLINANRKINNKTFQNVLTILKKINYNFDEEDLTEIFSLEDDSFVKMLENTKRPLR